MSIWTGWEAVMENQETKAKIVAEILALMAQHKIAPAEIEEPENHLEPEVSEN